MGIHTGVLLMPGNAGMKTVGDKLAPFKVTGVKTRSTRHRSVL